MSEKTEDTGTMEQSAQGLSASEVRNSEFFKSIVGPMAEENKELKARLAALENKEAEKARNEELRKQEEAGQFEQVKAQLIAEREAVEKRFAEEIQRRDIQAELMKRGANNDMFIKGAIANYDGSVEIAEYAQQLASDGANAIFFGVSDQSGTSPQPPPRGAVPASRSSNKNWSQLKADLKNGDPKSAIEARKAIEAYVIEHGELPPG